MKASREGELIRIIQERKNRNNRVLGYFIYTFFIKEMTTLFFGEQKNFNLGEHWYENTNGEKYSYSELTHHYFLRDDCFEGEPHWITPMAEAIKLL